MPRRIPDDRFERLVECATRVFIEQGYRRTQMGDIAESLGVAKGTVYLYVESKEALFDLVVRSADSTGGVAVPTALPVPTPAPGATLAVAEQRMAKGAALPALNAALERKQVRDARGELEEVVRELYRTLSANREGIKLLDRAGRDFPDLADLWFRGGREGLLGLFSEYIEDRIRRKCFRPVPDVTVAARLIIETIVFWAVHRHWDPHPQTIEESVSEETVVRFVVGALAEE
jgi:AcrR family transcriptional regulator